MRLHPFRSPILPLALLLACACTRGSTDSGTRAVVIGIDGADWRVIEALAAEGGMPHLMALRERGTWGPIATLSDIPLSPVIWTSVAMGVTSEGLAELRPVTFVFQEEFERRRPGLQFGLIAEEVAEVFPQLVEYDEEGRPYSVRYRMLTPLLLNELLEQQRLLGKQRAEIERLEEETRRLARLVDAPG